MGLWTVQLTAAALGLAVLAVLCGPGDVLAMTVPAPGEPSTQAAAHGKGEETPAEANTNTHPDTDIDTNTTMAAVAGLGGGACDDMYAVEESGWREAHPLPCLFLQHTNKYREDCPGIPGTDVRPLLITGTGRSGTEFIHKVFRQLGFGISHDDMPIGRQGAASWVLARAESTEKPYPSWSPHAKGTRFRHVFHQVRHPLLSIASRATGAIHHNIVTDHAPELKLAPGALRKNFLFRALIHYVTWNEFVSQYADWRYRVEEVNIREICERAGLQPCPTDAEVAAGIQAIPKTQNHRKHATVTWEDLWKLHPVMTARAQELARRWGYALQPAPRRAPTAPPTPQPHGRRRRDLGPEDGDAGGGEPADECVGDFCLAPEGWAALGRQK